MKWAVEIQKTNLDRRNLADLLDGLGFALIDGIEFPAFTSTEFDACDTAAEVLDKAKQIHTAFTGPAQTDSAFVLGAIINFSFDPPQRHVFLEAQIAVVTSLVGDCTVVISPPKGLSSTEIERWEKDRAEQEYQSKLEAQRARLEPAFRHPQAAKILELLSNNNHSGATLYKIYELVEGHPSNRRAFHARFDISIDQFNRFKDAVHNFKVSGDWARHAYEEDPKTNNPMSKDEAEQFVRQIAARWLEYARTAETI